MSEENTNNKLPESSDTSEKTNKQSSDEKKENTEALSQNNKESSPEENASSAGQETQASASQADPLPPKVNPEPVHTSDTKSSQNQTSSKPEMTITLQGKKKHTVTVKKVLQYVIVFVICGLCGFGGGWLAYDVHAKSETQSMPNENMPQGKGDFGGFPGQSETDTTSAALGVIVTSTDDGVVVEGFSSNSKAESAGIETGDVIEKLDGTETSSVEAIKSFLADKEPGDTVTITVKRDNEEKDIKVELVESSSMSSGNGSSSQEHTLPGNDSSDTYTG